MFPRKQVLVRYIYNEKEKLPLGSRVWIGNWDQGRGWHLGWGRDLRLGSGTGFAIRVEVKTEFRDGGRSLILGLGLGSGFGTRFEVGLQDEVRG